MKSHKTSGMPFRPPIPNPLMQSVLLALLPVFFRFNLGKLSMSVDAESLNRLKAVKGQRCLLLPNHPSEWDSWILAALGKQLDERFYYVAAREVFDYNWGIRGWLFQKMGVYSLVRGASDKDSFRTTKDILGNNRGRLVIFVEGEISNQNDSLLPLEPGVLQLAFLSLQDCYKACGKDLAQLPSLYVCPLAIKYVYHPIGLGHTIEQSLQALEKAVGLQPVGTLHYERIRSIGFTVLQNSARQFGYPLPEGAPLGEQILGLQNFMLTKLEQVVNLPYDAAMSYLDRVRRIRNTVDRVIRDVPEILSPYQESLHDHTKAVLENFYLDLDRIVNFIAIYDGYMHPEMLSERMVEVIRRLEKEVFGAYQLVHPRTAVVQALQPIDLKDHFAAFLQDKKQVAESLIHDIETRMYQAITTARLPEQLPVG